MLAQGHTEEGWEFPLPLSNNGIVMAWVHSLSGVICIRIESRYFRGEIIAASRSARRKENGGGERTRVLRHAPVVGLGYITANAAAHRGLHATYTHSFTCFRQGHTLAARARPPERRSATHTNHPPKSAFRGGGINLAVSLLLGSPPPSLSPLPLVFTPFLVMALASTPQS